MNDLTKVNWTDRQSEMAYVGLCGDIYVGGAE